MGYRVVLSECHVAGAPIMKSVVRSVVVAAVLFSMGCVRKTGPDVHHYDPSRPINRTHELRQDGKLVNRKEVEEGLLFESAARRYVKRGRTWSTVSLVFASAGGFLIGWPIGEAIVRSPDPNWELAAVGGGIATLSFLLIPVAVGNYNHAIDAHNELVGPTQVSFGDGKFRLEPGTQGLALKF
jgi:hypothetical protein